MTMAHADPEVNAVLEEFGAVAYGVYWLILEEIAAAMEPGKDTPDAIRSVQKWASICGVQPRVFRKIIAALSVHLINVCETSDGRLRIVVPNLLKYRDEYSRKSGHSPDQTKTESRADVKGFLAGEQRQSAHPESMPVQGSRAESSPQKIAVNESAGRPLPESGLKPASVPHDVAQVLESSKLADDIESMRSHLDAIDRDRLNGTLPPVDAGTAKNILAAIRLSHPDIEPAAAARLLVEGPLKDGHRVRAQTWGLIVNLAREL
jgi:hypothetical protein